MRVTGWSRVLQAAVDGREVIPEAELLDVIVQEGRTIGADWPKVIMHAMRALGWRLRRRSRTYVRKPPRVDASAPASTGGAS